MADRADTAAATADPAQPHSRLDPQLADVSPGRGERGDSREQHGYAQQHAGRERERIDAARTWGMTPHQPATQIHLQRELVLERSFAYCRCHGSAARVRT